MKTYFRILSYVKPYWKHLLLSVTATFFYAILNGASVYLAIPLLDTLFQESDVSTSIPETTTDPAAAEILPGWFSQFMNSLTKSFQEFIFSGTEVESLFKICALILFAFLGKNLFGYLQAYFLAFVEQGVIKDMRNQAYVHLHKLPMSFFKNEKTGNLISKITNDVNVVQSSVSAVFLNLVREPLTILVFLGIAMSISLHLTLFSFIVLPVSLAIIGWIGLKLHKQSGILQSKMADITNLLQETISGVKIVKAFGMEEYENNKFKKETFKFFKLSLRMVRVRNAASPITEFLSVIVGVIVIFYGGQLVLIDGTMRASEFLTFLFAIFQLMPPIKELSSVNNRIQESSAAAERVFEILDTEPNIKSAADAIRKTEFNEVIEFKNVSYKYEDSSVEVVKNISFKVNNGEIIALVGSSGSGKTTLVDLIPRFYDPVDGAILIDGIDIRKIKLEDLRKMMGIVTQETVLFNESVSNNIAYGLENFDSTNIIEAAKAANAHDFIINLPKGYDTIIGERGTKLSGGQRQRISIARALLKNPPIMIFDEATSALDNESEILVQEAIDRLMHHRTTFVIAHRLSTIRNANRILVLDNGQIVQDGKHDQLIKNSTGIYKRLYEMQFR
ncbi:MAG: ABC transporter transmembrane domain-containing protein [Melioribacteraceae bacterium]|nr:ABC transporter transmembrane domain-containing protein [Melioribacteraceae bacterium]